MAFSRTFIFIVASAVLAVIVLTSSLFTVSETEQAIVLQFGAVKHVDDFEAMSNLHSRSVFITVDSNDGLANALRGNGKFFT